MTDSTRDRLQQAARDVVAKDGLEGLTLRAIARHAGLSHGAPLRHFPSLASLLAAVAADGFDRLVDAVDHALADLDRRATAEGRVPTPGERLSAAGRAYVERALADPGVFSVTFRPERCDISDPEYQRAGAESFGQLQSLVEEAQAAGWRPDIPPVRAAAALWAGVHGLAELLIHGGLLGIPGVGTTDEVLDTYFDIVDTRQPTTRPTATHTEATP